MGHGNLYILIENIKTGEYFRFAKFAENEIPDGYRKKYKHKPYKSVNREFDVYDENDELKPQFWATKRMFPKNSDKIIMNGLIIKT